KDLAFCAVLDFDRLLQLADNADLERLDDFASIDVLEIGDAKEPKGTRITAHQIKNFVRRELRIDRRKGYVRNVASRNGLDQFVWHLSRCTPVAYQSPIETKGIGLKELLAVPPTMTLSQVEIRHCKSAWTLGRPIYPHELDAPPLTFDMLIPIQIAEGGMVAKGFLAGYESVIFPAVYRGITVRLRGVAIGDPGFLGA